MPRRKTLKTERIQSLEGCKLLKGAPGDVCRVCAVPLYLEHRSCGDTQPLTLPEYGDRKTIIPPAVEKNSQNKTKQNKNWRNLNGKENCNQDFFPYSMLKIQVIYILNYSEIHMNEFINYLLATISNYLSVHNIMFILWIVSYGQDLTE